MDPAQFRRIVESVAKVKQAVAVLEEAGLLDEGFKARLAEFRDRMAHEAGEHLKAHFDAPGQPETTGRAPAPNLTGTRGLEPADPTAAARFGRGTDLGPWQS